MSIESKENHLKWLEYTDISCGDQYALYVKWDGTFIPHIVRCNEKTRNPGDSKVWTFTFKEVYSNKIRVVSSMLYGITWLIRYDLP